MRRTSNYLLLYIAPIIFAILILPAAAAAIAGAGMRGISTTCPRATTFSNGSTVIATGLIRARFASP